MKNIFVGIVAVLLSSVLLSGCLVSVGATFPVNGGGIYYGPSTYVEPYAVPYVARPVYYTNRITPFPYQTYYGGGGNGHHHHRQRH